MSPKRLTYEPRWHFFSSCITSRRHHAARCPECLWIAPVRFQGKPPNAVSALCPQTFVVRPSQSERIVYLTPGLWSPSLTWISVSVWSTTIPDLTSLAASGRKLSRKKCRKKLPSPTALGQISSERFIRVSRNLTALSGTLNLTSMPDMTRLSVAIGCKNN